MLLLLYVVCSLVVSEYPIGLFASGQQRNGDVESTTESEDSGLTSTPDFPATTDAPDGTDPSLAPNETNLDWENVTGETDYDDRESTTTLVPPPPLANGTELPPSGQTPSGALDKELNVEDFCLCDLKVDVCDVNCCCDAECDWEDRKVFSHCQERPQPSLDSRYCFQENLLFGNRTEYSVAFVHPGAFCIVTDNLPRRTTYTLMKGATNFNEYEKLKEGKRRHSYSWIPSYERSTPDSLEPYKDGAHVWGLDDRGALFILGIPTSLVGTDCETSTPVLYLHDAESSCNRAMAEDLAQECQSNSYLSARHYLAFSVAADPRSLFQNRSIVEKSTEADIPQSTIAAENTSEESPGYDSISNSTDKLVLQNTNKTEDADNNAQGELVSPAEITEAPSEFGEPYPEKFVAVRPFLCRVKDGDEICTEENLKDVPLPTYDNSGACNDVLSRVDYVFLHNGSEGIYDVRAKVYLATVTADAIHAKQRFSAKYLWSPTEEKKVLERSGRPGYIQGKPLLMGRLIENRTEEDILKEGISLNTDPTHWMRMVVPGSQGNCDSYTQVTFGVDLGSGCLLQVTQEDFEHNCQSLQGKILAKLLGPTPLSDSKMRIASYGDSSVENPADWVPVLVPEEPQCGTSNRVSGTSSSVYFSLITSLHVEVAFSYQGSLANPQAKVVGVSLRFGEPREVRPLCLHALCLPGSGSTTASVELESSVAFVDVSRPPSPSYSQPPALDVKLPYDFFYPFLPSSSSSSKYLDIMCFIVSAILCILMMK